MSTSQLSVEERDDRRAGPRVRRQRGAAGRPRAGAREHLSRGAHRADEGARRVRARRPGAVRRRAGLDGVLRARHRGARPRMDEPGRRDGRAQRRLLAARHVRHRRSSSERYLPRLATGELRATMALTEPGGGSDLQAMRTTARRDGDEWVVDGVEDVDQQRPPRRADRAAVQDRSARRPAAPGHEHPAGRARARAHRRAGPAEARLQGRRELRGRPRRLPGAAGRRPRRASRAAASRR